MAYDSSNLNSGLVIRPIETVPDIGGEVDFENSRFVYGGQYTEVRQATWLDEGGTSHEVAIRILSPNRRFQEEIPKILQRLSRQHAVWSKLVHPNVARFLGKAEHTLYVDNAFRDVPCLISEWHTGYTLETYVAKTLKSWNFCKTPEATTGRLELIKSLGSGLLYLHQKKIVHGDFDPSNVIFNTITRMPVIIDFGYSRIVSVPGFTTTNKAGSARYRAPRGENDSKFGTVQQPMDISNAAGSQRSDVWSFGMVALLVLSCQKPYHELGAQDDFIVDEVIQLAKLSGEIPLRATYPILSHHRWDALWEVLKACWRKKDERPNMYTVLESLKMIFV